MGLRLAKAIGLSLLTVGALGVNIGHRGNTAVFQEYLSRQEKIDEYSIERAHEFTDKKLGFNYNDLVYGALISTGAILMTWERRRKKE